MRRTDVLNELVTAPDLAHYLHGDRTRGGAHFAHEHPPDPTCLVSQIPPPAAQTRRSQQFQSENPAKVS
jgi:hypothetical protein